VVVVATLKGDILWEQSSKGVSLDNLNKMYGVDNENC